MPIKTIAGIDLFQEIRELLQLKFSQAVVFIFDEHISAEMELFTSIRAGRKIAAPAQGLYFYSAIKPSPSTLGKAGLSGNWK